MMAPRAKFTGTGMFVPDRVVTNDDLAKLMDTSDEWIRKRSGIAERRYIEEGQTPASLAQKASERALESGRYCRSVEADGFGPGNIEVSVRRVRDDRVAGLVGRLQGCSRSRSP